MSISTALGLIILAANWTLCTAQAETDEAAGLSGAACFSWPISAGGNATCINYEGKKSCKYLLSAMESHK